MKLIIVIALATLAVVAGRPEEAPIFKILRSEFDQEPAGGYKYAFETENGIVRDEVGSVKVLKDEEGKDQEVVVISGSYSYTDPTGQLISVKYIADETGFHAEGDHIPKPDARR